MKKCHCRTTCDHAATCVRTDSWWGWHACCDLWGVWFSVSCVRLVSWWQQAIAQARWQASHRQSSVGFQLEFIRFLCSAYLFVKWFFYNDALISCGSHEVEIFILNFVPEICEDVLAPCYIYDLLLFSWVISKPIYSVSAKINLTCLILPYLMLPNNTFLHKMIGWLSGSGSFGIVFCHSLSDSGTYICRIHHKVNSETPYVFTTACIVQVKPRPATFCKTEPNSYQFSPGK